MAKTNTGRRAAARNLGLLERPGSNRAGYDDDVIEMEPRQGRSRTTARRGRQRSSRRLPSDRRIAGAIGRRIFRWIYRILAAFALLSVLTVIAYRYINPPVTPLMLMRPLEAIGEGHFVGITKSWIDIDRVDPDLLRSLIAAEDARFMEHGGIDWKAVEDAQKANEKTEGEKLRGGSTITMQCAKNVFLWQGRNYLRKGLEAYFTYLIELLWGKRRILEVYLNVIEWGDGIYGADAAAREYFGTGADRLTPRQAALLAAILPSPRRYSAEKPGPYVSRRASRIQAGARSVGLDALLK